MVEHLQAGGHRGGTLLSPSGFSEGHEILLGKIERVLDGPCSGSPDIRRGTEHVDQSDVGITQTRIFGVFGKETTKLRFVVERGLECLVKGDGDALWKGGDAGDKSLRFWSLGYIADVGMPWGTGRMIGIITPQDTLQFVTEVTSLDSESSPHLEKLTRARDTPRVYGELETCVCGHSRGTLTRLNNLWFGDQQ